MNKHEKSVLAGLCRIEIARWRSLPDKQYMVDLMEIALASLTAESIGELHCDIGNPDFPCVEFDGTNYGALPTNGTVEVYTAPPVPDLAALPSCAEIFISAIEKEQGRLVSDDYLMDSKDCIDVIREEVQRRIEGRDKC